VTWLLDTSILSHAARGHMAVRDRLASVAPSDLRVSAITVHEVEYGLLRNPTTRVAEPIRKLLGEIESVAFDGACARTAATIRLALEKAGTLIGAYDLLISATALTHGWTAVTANTKEFGRVLGLQLEDWTQGASTE
jgi:tRNA(fMet)-specific endonuclease VapC